jgi:hypothetical protein
LIEKLRGGDRRSIGRVEEVIADVLAEPRLFAELFDCMISDDPAVRMRAADAAEKISVKQPDWLQPFKNRLLGEIAAIDQQEVRWHVAQMIPRLELDIREQVLAQKILTSYLNDKSRIVVTFAMTALAQLASDNPQLQPKVIKLINELSRTGSPAIQTRARKLLTKLL